MTLLETMENSLYYESRLIDAAFAFDPAFWYCDKFDSEVYWNVVESFMEGVV